MNEFAERQLTKYGWKKGAGLGKRQEGITRAVTVAYKTDTKGLGKQNNEWEFEWWDHVFNRASSGIKVEKDDSGVIQIESKVKENRIKEERKKLYSWFCRASFQLNSAELNSDQSRKDFTIKVTDEELLAACEGRTARKGARVDQVGKCERAEGQTDSHSTTEWPAKKKKKKSKDSASKEENKDSGSEKKKKKKSKKNKSSSADTVIPQNEELSSKKRKRAQVEGENGPARKKTKKSKSKKKSKSSNIDER